MTQNPANTVNDSKEISRVKSIAAVVILGPGMLGVFLILKSLVDSWIGQSNLLSSRIGAASVLVMQIDSFLAAGFIVGFFQFQGEVSKMIQEIARLKMTSEIAKPEVGPRLGSWTSEKGLSFFAGYRFLC